MVASFVGWLDSLKRNPAPVFPTVYSLRYSKYLRTSTLNTILTPNALQNVQCRAGVKTAAKNAPAMTVRVSLEKRLCYPCTETGFGVAACAHCCMGKHEVDNLQLFLLWWFLFLAGQIV